MLENVYTEAITLWGLYPVLKLLEKKEEEEDYEECILISEALKKFSKKHAHIFKLPTHIRHFDDPSYSTIDFKSSDTLSKVNKILPKLEKYIEEKKLTILGK